MTPDDNRSCWLDEAPPYAPLPPLRGARRSPTSRSSAADSPASRRRGISASAFPSGASSCSRRSALANGASGRNGGQALNWINGVDADDPERAAPHLRGDPQRHRSHRAIWSKRYRLDAGFDRRGCLEVYTSARGAETGACARRAPGARPAFRSSGVDAAASGVHGAHGGVRDPQCGARQRRSICCAACDRCSSAAGVAVYEQTPVHAVEEGATIAPARRRTGSVRAAAVVLATNAYTPALGYFARSASCRCTRTSSPPAPLSERALVSARLGRPRRLRRRPRPHRLRLPHRRRPAALRRRRQRRLRVSVTAGAPRFLADDAARARASPRWSATCTRYFPRRRRRRSPIAGAARSTSRSIASASMGVRGAHRNVYYALGYSGHGIALAMLAGRVLRDLYSGDHDAVARPALLPERHAAPAARAAALARLPASTRASPAARRGGTSGTGGLPESCERAGARSPRSAQSHKRSRHGGCR